ncbi:Mur ligase family protein [Dokdonella sp.]|uniref:Mur ligase family protein n=1 Tax=Dokdonella sp. TaxID=2291710 RepID=UPI0035270700
MGRRRARRARHPSLAGAGRLSAIVSLSFEDSRRLTGPNLYFAEPGAVLEAVGEVADSAVAAWRANIATMREHLGWPEATLCVRAHRGGMALAFAAPIDQLFTATEVNEWAWMAAIGKTELFAPGHPHGTDPDSALQMLLRHSAAERRPDLFALIEIASKRGVPVLLDDDCLSIGSGKRSQIWPLAALPHPDTVAWSRLGGIPTALVTGSNGKTTTVRLLAAMLNAHGLRCGFSCTDGVFIDGRMLEAGDYSGPAGARSVLRAPVEAAILETARGGLLRRGLAVGRADAAIVTNISDDHFGEYGIDDLEGLTDAKLIVARALDPRGTLVLNADNELLRKRAQGQPCRVAWFSLDDSHPLLRSHRANGGTTCGVLDNRLWLSHGDARLDLGAVSMMPLSANGHAAYNISNIAGASLLADALGVPATTISDVVLRFGLGREDNPGRLERWQFGGISVLMDYAHNPEGLHGLLSIARALGGSGRLGLILGQAGNRGNTEIRSLAAMAARFEPAIVVLKEMQGFMRGRARAEVAQLLRDALLALGMTPESLPMMPSEQAAAREALAWARPGDTIVLPVHERAARDAVRRLLDHLEETGWQAGQALPGTS